jgi:hypothetical protein
LSRAPVATITARLQINSRRTRRHKRDAIGRKLVIAKLLGRKLAHSGNDAVAERAGRKGATSFDEMNGDTRVGTSKRARDACPGKAAADNDDMWSRLLCKHWSRQQRRTAPGGQGL